MKDATATTDQQWPQSPESDLTFDKLNKSQAELENLVLYAACLSKLVKQFQSLVTEMTGAKGVKLAKLLEFSQSPVMLGNTVESTYGRYAGFCDRFLEASTLEQMQAQNLPLTLEGVAEFGMRLQQGIESSNSQN